MPFLVRTQRDGNGRGRDSCRARWHRSTLCSMKHGLGRSTLVCVAIGLTASAAHAQGSSADKAAAQALFEEGKQLLDAGNAARACPKFEASQKLDAGVGTQLNLADCYERVGKTASAWAIFLEAASTAKAQGQSDREQIARDRARTLEGKLAKLTLAAGDAQSMQGAEVTINGRAIPQDSWGVPLPIDPGTQQIEVRAPGKKPWSSTVEVKPGPGEQTVTIPALEAAPKSETSSAPTSRVSTQPSPTMTTHEDRGGGLRTAGWITAGVGILGVGVGSYFGLAAVSKNRDSKGNCRTATLCDPAGLSLRNDAKDAATISTIAFVAGGALVAGGVTLLLLGRSDEEPRAALSVTGAPSFAAVTLGGRF